MPTVVTSKIKLYADDALLYRSIHSDQDINTLQDDLDALSHWATTWQMKFNPNKCEHLRISNKLNLITSRYYINKTLIREVPHAKYLGVTIDQKLTWHKHINNIVNKGNLVYGFLQRNLRKCPMLVKSQCYLSLLRPVLEYVATVWSPHYQEDIDKIEMVQRRAARFVLNRGNRYDSVSKMIDYLGWPKLETRRVTAKLVMFYKIINNLVDIHIDDIQTQTPYHYTRGHPLKFSQLYTRVDAYKFSFIPSTIKLWNTLPDHVVNQQSIEKFCNNMHTQYLLS